jgi:hypothetical protein
LWRKEFTEEAKEFLLEFRKLVLLGFCRFVQRLSDKFWITGPSSFFVARFRGRCFLIMCVEDYAKKRDGFECVKGFWVEQFGCLFGS